MGNDFADFICDQLGGLRSRAMFGGVGLYRGDEMIGLIYDGRVYAKTDEAGRARFEAAGSQPFSPRPTQTLRWYWEVPPDALDSPDELRSWFPPPNFER